MSDSGRESVDTAPPASQSRAPRAPGTIRRFRVAADVELTGEAWGNAGAPAVVLLHGGGQTRHSWAGTAQALADDGWYAVAVDMRGHGDSDWPDAPDYHHLHFAEDAVALAAHFDPPPVLVGASLGGIASLLATEISEGPVASALVLVDIATRMERRGAERIIDFMKAKPEGFDSLEEVADAVSAYNPHRPRPDDLSGLAKNLRQLENGRYTWHWDPRFLERAPDAAGVPKQLHEPELLDRAASKLAIPTLLVRGRMSDLLSEEGARTFLEQVPHAEYADVSGAGHMVAGDRNDLFTTAVRSFLREALRG